MKKLKPCFVALSCWMLLSGFSGSSASYASALDPVYRDLSRRVRDKGEFKVLMPGQADQNFSYELSISGPFLGYESGPKISDFYLDEDQRFFVRRFVDKLALRDGSYILLGGEKVPLVCVFVDGRDNRYSGKTTPLVPDFLLKVYLVANDFSCTGPINPNWPRFSPKKETWDTYLHYEVRDPTIMLPVEPKLRYRWSEFTATVVAP